MTLRFLGRSESFTAHRLLDVTAALTSLVAQRTGYHVSLIDVISVRRSTTAEAAGLVAVVDAIMDPAAGSASGATIDRVLWMGDYEYSLDATAVSSSSE
jgi:hypothetical protein